ncbi:hypothetical protein COCCADRAFT_21897 [Bipolaris zeicola 26-R-13]|uniref:Uncharacterized protein n=1 Tax=Cochliobolus carbonum (strain 26-R-13) TaxID=930089 RepID=W6YTY6_COCC2|nr:uncharacterized protein COCCADRAFT_21897 [Bipolaris zeicola 26-R-13]EUC38874.1 hypothetical protein COCCADRAFT_21897 [Bipolaris zeicola 26-R-13]
MHPLEAAMHVFGGDDTAESSRKRHMLTLPAIQGLAAAAAAAAASTTDDVKSSGMGGRNTDLRNAIAFRAWRCPRQRETAPSANACRVFRLRQHAHAHNGHCKH